MCLSKQRAIDVVKNRETFLSTYLAKNQAVYLLWTSIQLTRQSILSQSIKPGTTKSDKKQG